MCCAEMSSREGNMRERGKNGACTIHQKKEVQDFLPPEEIQLTEKGWPSKEAKLEDEHREMRKKELTTMVP